MLKQTTEAESDAKNQTTKRLELEVEYFYFLSWKIFALLVEEKKVRRLRNQKEIGRKMKVFPG